MPQHAQRSSERVANFVSLATHRIPLTPSRFLQIGEISLMKEMTSVASTMMSDEEKAEKVLS